MSFFCLRVVPTNPLYLCSCCLFFSPLRGCSEWPHWREQDWGWRCLRQSACHGVCTEGAGQLSSESERHSFTAHPGALRRWETGTSSLLVRHPPPSSVRSQCLNQTESQLFTLELLPNLLDSVTFRLLSLPLIPTFLFFTFNIRCKPCWNREVNICVRVAWAGKMMFFKDTSEMYILSISLIEDLDEMICKYRKNIWLCLSPPTHKRYRPFVTWQRVGFSDLLALLCRTCCKKVQAKYGVIMGFSHLTHDGPFQICKKYWIFQSF